MLTAVAMVVTSALCAQSESKYRTDIPLSQQLKKGLVPGAKFATTTTQLNLKPQPAAPEASITESFSARLRKNALPGFKYQAGGGVAANAVAPKQPQGNITLASSAPAGKQDNKQTTLKPVTNPTQANDAAPRERN